MGRVWCVCVGCDTHRLSCGVSDVIHFVLTVDVIVDIYISRLVARRSVVVLGVENTIKPYASGASANPANRAGAGKGNRERSDALYYPCTQNELLHFAVRRPIYGTHNFSVRPYCRGPYGLRFRFVRFACAKVHLSVIA